MSRWTLSAPSWQWPSALWPRLPGVWEQGVGGALPAQGFTQGSNSKWQGSVKGAWLTEMAQRAVEVRKVRWEAGKGGTAVRQKGQQC